VTYFQHLKLLVARVQLEFAVVVFTGYRRDTTVNVNTSPPDGVNIVGAADGELVKDLAEVFAAVSDDRKRMRGGVIVTGEAVMAVRDLAHARPDLLSEEIHVLEVTGAVRRHQLHKTVPETSSEICIYRHRHELYTNNTPFTRSSNHQANIEQLEHMSCTCILKASAGCLLDDCSMFAWSCTRGIMHASYLLVVCSKFAWSCKRGIRNCSSACTGFYIHTAVEN